MHNCAFTKAQRLLSLQCFVCACVFVQHGKPRLTVRKTGLILPNN